MSNYAIFKDLKSQGTSAAAETTSYVTRPVVEIFDDLNISVSAGALTFGTTGIYAIRAKCQHFGPSARRFVHRVHKNGTATGLASTATISDNISNWVSISYNILSLTAGDIITIKSKTDTTTSTFAGKAGSVAQEVYTEIEVEKQGAVTGALFYYSKAANNAGDNEAILYTNRTLVSSVTNIVGMSLNTGRVVFPAGNFRIRTLCTHFGAAGRKFIHKFNGPSMAGIGNNIGNCLTESITYLNTTGQTVPLQSKVDSITGTPTMGKQGNLGEVEIYGLVDILKI